MYKNKSIILSIVLLMILLVSFTFLGCKKSIATTTTATGTTAAAETTTAVAETTEKKSTVLTMASPQDIDNYNPFTQQYIAFNIFKYNLYETLLIYDEKGDIQPSLATSIDKVDDLTYKVNVRPNVKFHNGDILKASDVKFTFNYILTNEEAAFFKPSLSKIQSMDATDDNTLVIKLSAVDPDFLGAMTNIPIVKEGTVDQLSANPIGTGPFKFKEWQPNEKTDLVKFDGYWDAGKPKLDEVIVRPITDPKIQVANLESKTVQLVKSVPLEEYDALKANQDLVLYPLENTTGVVVLEIGQKNNPALKNPKVLEAMWYAMDREKINNACFNGLAKIINGPYDTGRKYFDAGTKKEITYDPAKAKALLEEAGYKDGFTFSIDVLPGFSWPEKFAEIWQANLKDVGITCKINVLEASLWIKDYLARSYDMILNFGGLPGKDPSGFHNTITVPLVTAAFPNPKEMLSLIEKGQGFND
ncbi:MAG: ABC transporter substrate-binding protein [Actinobacteria bacterium]|nr:ABC transporter substrate-binding protein [Actinomycetota bacterium]